MDDSLHYLCNALKTLLAHLKPKTRALSFLLLTGKNGQGKTTLLRQSQMTHYPIDLERVNVYYNRQGIILELGEAWFEQSPYLMDYTLKQLNRCHRLVKITGLILCVDSSAFILADSNAQLEQCKAHTLFLERFFQTLNGPLDVAILFTKLDSLAGFCDFFQMDHNEELAKPLGFSLPTNMGRNKLILRFRQRFDQMLEVLGQQIIGKLHPARSSAKRSLIREFPLQLSSLRVPLQALIQHISKTQARIHSIYFTSAEQGGVSINRLNKKIQQEYALVIPDKFPQSNNYRSYFIKGALRTFQDQTKCYPQRSNYLQRWGVGATVGLAGLTLIVLTVRYYSKVSVLDEASKELLQFEAALTEPYHQTTALYHLSKASQKLDQLKPGVFSISSIDALKGQLRSNTEKQLYHRFLPNLLSQVESVINDSQQSPAARYQALKVYLMLGEPQHYIEKEVLDWFNQFWQSQLQQNDKEKQLALLKSTLIAPRQPLPINQGFVLEARNYLNALPTSYLYYSIAKLYFPSQQTLLKIEGFHLAQESLPFIYTKPGYKEVMEKLPSITQTLIQDNWVLARQDLKELTAQLEEAYTFEYANFWQRFMDKSQLQHALTYPEAQNLSQKLASSQAFSSFTTLVQQQTSPDITNLRQFNERVASKFTPINLIPLSAVSDLSHTIGELQPFLSTLVLVNDQGQTAFNLAKMHFMGNHFTDPLSRLYRMAQQLPEPITRFAKQIGDEIWVSILNDTKKYINHQWQEVFTHYQQFIANRFPLDVSQKEEIDIQAFNRFFSPHGLLNTFIDEYLKPFVDTSTAQWQPRELNGYQLPVSSEMMDELIRANVITNMFFPRKGAEASINFSLQKINLDPVVSRLRLTIGQVTLADNQNTDSYTQFNWPQSGAKLSLNSVEGNQFEIEEFGPWAFFKILQKVNVLVDNEDSTNLHILFEINGNSGRYLLKTQNQINPFSPGILAGFLLNQNIV